MFDPEEIMKTGNENENPDPNEIESEENPAAETEPREAPAEEPAEPEAEAIEESLTPPEPAEEPKPRGPEPGTYAWFQVEKYKKSVANRDAMAAALSGRSLKTYAILDSVKDTTDEIYARLEAGESFEDLIAEYGEDPGMQNEPTMTSGYYVSNESQNWEVNFRDAAMALEQVGQYTETPVLSGSGVHIIQYTADVLGGEVGLDTVREALYAATLEELQAAHCDEIIAAWVAEVNPVYNVEALEAAYGAGY